MTFDLARVGKRRVRIWCLSYHVRNMDGHEKVHLPVMVHISGIATVSFGVLEKLPGMPDAARHHIPEE